MQNYIPLQLFGHLLVIFSLLKASTASYPLYAFFDVNDNFLRMSSRVIRLKASSSTIKTFEQLEQFY